MQAIVNVDQNWGIGCGGDLLFPIPNDMKFFRETTQGKVVVMGSKTLASFPSGKPLKNRTNIVLTRRSDYAPEGVQVCRSLAELSQLLAPYAPEDVFVIGGQSIYSQLIDYCESALVTKVDAAGDADTYFPNLDSRDGWTLAEEGAPMEHEGVYYRFCTYHNSNPLCLPDK